MSSKAPPTPPQNRSPKGPGDAKTAPVDQTPHGRSTGNPDRQEQAANTKINTTHQGHQQDR